MADPTEPLLQECVTCGALIDISDEEPFALMHCPTCGAAMRVRREFGNFELQEILGAGGMGAVYRAQDTTLGRSVALKLLRKEYTESPEFVKQFEHEASITAQINHPNVVKVYSTASDHGLYYIAMELVDKGSLDDLMTLQGSIAEAQVLEVGVQIAHGLQAAFRQGLIHRDVKPGNILFADANHAKIVDFGLAQRMGHDGEVAGEVWGTPYYVAPEKLDSPPKEDLRSDIYSLGATLFHAIAGRPPYEAEEASMVALKHLKSQPVSLQAFAPKVSTATAYVINRALNKEPAERFQTYEEFIDHLEYARTQLLAGGGSRQKSRVILEDERSQQMMSWVTIGILAALIFGGVGLYFYRDKILGPEPKPITPAPHPTEAAIQADADYQNAIGMLAAGRTSDAAVAFQKVEAAPDLAQPLRNWTTLQAGVSLLLDGRVEEAKPEFQKLVDLGPYSFDPAEEKLANFFPATARAELGTDPIPAPAADDSKNNFEAMGWFAGAAKDAAMGDLADAEALYRKFESSSPETPYDWLAKYHDLAGKRAAEIAAYRELEGKIKGAVTVEQQKAVLPVVKEELTRPELKGQFAGQAASLVEEFEKQVTSGAEVQNQKMAAQDAEDAKVIAAAAAKFNALCREYKFAEAKAAVAGAQVGGEKGKAEKARLEKIAGWLDRFKERVISDLSASPAPGPITRLNGVPMEGNIVGATDAQLQLSTKYGPVPLKWTELSFQTIYGMARRNIRVGVPPESLADREWDLGVFCWLMKQEREKKAMFDAAAAAKPNYQEETKAFEESGEAPAAKP